MMSQKKNLGKTPEGDLQESEGSFHKNDALETPQIPPTPPRGSFQEILPWDIIDGL